MGCISRVLLACTLLVAAFSIHDADAQVRTQTPLRPLIVPQQLQQQQNQIQDQATAQTQTFNAPSIQNVRLDWCAHFGRDCGQPAADLFCREMQFDRATRFVAEPNIGARGIPTLVFGDGALCQAPNCTGFRSITCQKTAVATEQAPPRVPPLQTQPTQRQPPPVVQQEEQPVFTEEEPTPPTPPVRQQPVQTVTSLPPLQIAPITPEVIELLKMGDIYLDQPEVGPKWTGEFENPQEGVVPLWDDETVFKWHPSNPGMADTYDLRFFTTEAGGTPIGSVKIPGDTNFMHPTVDFLVDTLGKLDLQRPPFSKDIDFKKGDLFWEVAGYRGYNTSGVVEEPSGESDGDKINAQIAVSKRWPLRVPDEPNGYGVCGSGEGQTPEFNPANLLLENKDGEAAENRPAGVNYIYDLIQVSGEFSLETSPYASHPKTIMLPPAPGQNLILNVKSYVYDNVFVDWGDGTVEPLTVDALDQYQYYRNSRLGLPTDPPFGHRYQSAGTFTIRIFQISEADLQGVDVGTLDVAYEVNNKATPVGVGLPGGGAPKGYYDALIQQQAGGAGNANAQVDPSKIPILQGGFPLEVANRAYVVFCNPVVVMEPKDDKAFGPLALYSVDLEFDQAHAVDKSDPIEGKASSCDQSATVRAHLQYAGKGRVTVVWKIDGVMIGGITEFEVGPSPARSGKELADGAPVKQGTWVSDWVPLEVSEAMIGGHQVTVEINVKETQLLVRSFLRPSKAKETGAPPVVTVPIIFVYPIADDGKIPKKSVTSPARNYTVVESDSSKPCHLRFLVSDGAFDVFLPDPDAVTVSGDKVAGAGNLLVKFANKGNALSVPINFSDWQMEGSGDVVAGALSVAGIADGKVNLPGLSVAVKALEGSASASDGAVDATIDVTAEGGALREANGTPKPPVWKGEASRLAPNGDWHREGAAGLPSSFMGWSGFTIQSSGASLDFSDAEGVGPGNVCGAAGADWIGVRLNAAKVRPNLFNLGTVDVPVDNWVIGEVSSGNGLCGDLVAENPVPSKPIGEGKIAIKHLEAKVRAGFVKDAKYAMDVDVPILDVHLTGTGKLMETAGATPSWDLSGLTGPAVNRNLGPLSLQASGYVFGTDASGWRVKTNAVLSLAAESKPFAKVTANAMRVGMNGRIYFDDAGGKTRTVPLSGKSTLGQSPVDLVSATLTGTSSGNTRLNIQVSTKLKLSASLPAPDVGAAYQLTKLGGVVSAAGPQTTPFEVKIAFPAGQPGMSATINPHYIGGAPAPGVPSGVKFYAGPGDAVVDYLASSSPIQSSFVLGYVGSDDYWMTLTDYNLGPTGIVLVAPILNLFNINGGLGYHVNTDSFVGLSDIKNVPPSAGTGLTFLAGMGVGTPDKQTFSLDGQLKMTEVEKVRFDFTAWILRAKSGSTGDFTGFFQYGGGSFDGQVWGGMNILDGAVKISADAGAVDMHFGSGGPWHVYLGRREGPKISATLLNLGGTDGFMMLSGDGFFVGSGMHIDLGGDIGPFSAHVKGWLNTELGIEPAIPRVSGSASGGLSVKGCAFDLCVGPDASVTVSMSALPVSVSAEACFEVDLWIDTVGACGHVSL